MSLDKEIKKIPRKLIVEKQRYEKSVIECKKLRNFIKSVVGGNIIVLSEIEYNNIRI